MECRAARCRSAAGERELALQSDSLVGPLTHGTQWLPTLYAQPGQLATRTSRLHRPASRARVAAKSSLSAATPSLSAIRSSRSAGKSSLRVAQSAPAVIKSIARLSPSSPERAWWARKLAGSSRCASRSTRSGDRHDSRTGTVLSMRCRTASTRVHVSSTAVQDDSMCLTARREALYPTTRHAHTTSDALSPTTRRAYSTSRSALPDGLTYHQRDLKRYPSRLEAMPCHLDGLPDSLDALPGSHDAR
jgi:hypothetical protein